MEAELQPRVDRRRIRLATAAPGDLSGTLDAFDAFRREVIALNAESPDLAEDIEVLCEPQPVLAGRGKPWWTLRS